MEKQVKDDHHAVQLHDRKEKEGAERGGVDRTKDSPDDPLLLPGARRPHQRTHSTEGSSSAAAPGSAADVDHALAVTSSRVVREQSGEALAAIQLAATTL